MYFSNSALFYDQTRRRRARQSYQDYLAGDVEDIAGSEVAASAAAANSMWRSVGIGVATGVLTLIVNHWVEKTFFKGSK